MPSLFDLTGKVAIVTGSTKGIGLAIATRMAEHGATVVISSRKPDACEAVAAGIRDDGRQGGGDPCHIARKEELQNLVDQTVARCGGIDILVENAGVNPYLGPSAGMPDEAFDRVMGSNVRSNVWLANMAIPHMVAARRRGGDHYFVYRRAARVGQLGRLRDLQGGRHAVGAEYRGGVGAEEHPRQRDRAGAGADGFRPGVVGRSGAVSQAHQGHAAAADRRAGRDCRRGSVSRVGRGQFYDRPDDRDRRRHDRGFGREMIEA